MDLVAWDVPPLQFLPDLNGWRVERTGYDAGGNILLWLKKRIVSVLPGVTQDRILPSATLKDLGADSVDRA